MLLFVTCSETYPKMCKSDDLSYWNVGTTKGLLLYIE